MTKILLLSDTHSHMDDRILTYAKEADEVWHAGDIGSLEVTDALKEIKPVRAVYGNIDGDLIRREFPLNNRFRCEGVEVWITHIGGYPGRYATGMRTMFKESPVDLFISGHSHILKVIYDDKFELLHMNPGAAGNSGFHKVRTLIRFVIDGNKIKDLEVIELCHRG